MKQLLTTLTILLLVAGCDSGGADQQSISGMWRFTEDGVRLTMDITSGSARSIAGTGSLTVGLSSVDFTVSGTYQEPDVEISMTTASGGLRFVGTLSAGGSVMTGQVISLDGETIDNVSFSKQ